MGLQPAKDARITLIKKILKPSASQAFYPVSQPASVLGSCSNVLMNFACHIVSLYMVFKTHESTRRCGRYKHQLLPFAVINAKWIHNASSL